MSAQCFLRLRSFILLVKKLPPRPLVNCSRWLAHEIVQQPVTRVQSGSFWVASRPCVGIGVLEAEGRGLGGLQLGRDGAGCEDSRVRGSFVCSLCARWLRAGFAENKVLTGVTVGHAHEILDRELLHEQIPGFDGVAIGDWRAPFDDLLKSFVQIEIVVESDLTAHLVPCDQEQVPVALVSQAAPQREFLLTLGVETLNGGSHRDIWGLRSR